MAKRYDKKKMTFICEILPLISLHTKEVQCEKDVLHLEIPPPVCLHTMDVECKKDVLHL